MIVRIKEGANFELKQSRRQHLASLLHERVGRKARMMKRIGDHYRLERFDSNAPVAPRNSKITDSCRRIRPRERLFLLDSMNFVFRQFHQPNARFQRQDGMPTRCVLVFHTLLRKLLRSSSRPTLRQL